MKKGSYIGELEEIIMLTIAALQPNAYGVAIKNEILNKLDRKLTLSAVHTVMHRLENKNFLISDFGESTPERGGKRKRYFKITPEGSNALTSLRDSRIKLWAEVPDYIISSS